MPASAGASRVGGLRLSELLVVLMLLGATAGLLHSCTGRAAEMENRALCAGNLKEIGRAAHVSARRHRDRWPDAFTPEATRWDQIGDTRTDRYDVVGASAEPDMTAKPGDTNKKPNSNTAGLWLLIAHGGLTPELFICPSQQRHLVDATVQDYKSVQDFRGAPFISYSYQNVFGPYTLLSRTGIPAEFAVLADANPMRRDFMEKGSGQTARFLASPDAGQFRPRSTETDAWNSRGLKPEGPWELNSPNHGFAGQNCLYLDGHVAWTNHPYCGLKGDNIWLARDPAATGEPDPADLESLRAHNDDASYDGVTALPAIAGADSFLVP